MGSYCLTGRVSAASLAGLHVPAEPVQSMKLLIQLSALYIAIGSGSGVLLAGSATVPGAVTTPYPTLHILAVEWAVTGDSNNNGVVTMRYGEAASGEWHAAMPLRRVPAGTARDETANRSWTNRHSGSIFDLSPDMARFASTSRVGRGKCRAGDS